MTKTLCVLALGFFIGINAHAVSITCNDIKVAATNNAIDELKLDIKAESISKEMESMLRQSLVVHGMHTKDEAEALSLNSIFADFDPYFSFYIIGRRGYLGVNLAYGGNPFLYFFEGPHFSGLIQEDGIIDINGQQCTELEADLF